MALKVHPQFNTVTYAHTHVAETCGTIGLYILVSNTRINLSYSFCETTSKRVRHVFILRCRKHCFNTSTVHTSHTAEAVIFHSYLPLMTVDANTELFYLFLVIVHILFF